MGHLTISFGTQLGHDISNADVDDTEETLVLFLKLLLVEDLDGQDTIFVGTAMSGKSE